jgi:TolB-like protein
MGWARFFEKDYTTAESIFLQLVVTNPNDSRNLKGLGVTQLMLKKYDDAQKYLEQSLQINKEDPETVLNLGILYEAQQKYDQSVEYYTKYVDMPGASMKSDVQKLLSNVKRTIYKNQAQSILSDENKLTDKDISKGTVAIVPFYNRGEKGDYEALQKGIPQMMTTDFGNVQKLNILERLRIEELLKEMKLSESNMMEKSTAQRLGKLLKAENIITGSYSVNNGTLVRMDAIVINVSTGQLSDLIEKNGTIEDFFSVQKDLSLGTLEKMNISLTEDQRKKIKTLPTESFFEFLAALKKRTTEEEEFTFQGPEFLNSAVVQAEVPVSQVSTISNTSATEITTTTNPVETPLPKPPGHP